jgi:hypothetical protein
MRTHVAWIIVLVVVAGWILAGQVGHADQHAMLFSI